MGPGCPVQRLLRQKTHHDAAIQRNSRKDIKKKKENTILQKEKEGKKLYSHSNVIQSSGLLKMEKKK